MLRVAGIPARVVIGYTHPAPDVTGTFEVTSDDAHAWVEAYFTGIGWLPFDPTPLTGVDASRVVALPWAPHPTISAGGGAALDPGALSDPGNADTGNTPVAATTSTGGGADSTATHVVWLSLAALAFIALIAAALPSLLRIRRRRQRLRSARELGPEPLWAELAATADDLGLGWSDARSTRQVAVWLGEQSSTASTRSGLMTLAAAVERERYAAADPQRVGSGWSDPDAWARCVEALRALRAELMATASPRVRWQARLLPASLRRSRRPDPGADRATTVRPKVGQSR
jgi:hypothetical protein